MNALHAFPLHGTDEQQRTAAAAHLTSLNLTTTKYEVSLNWVTWAHRLEGWKHALKFPNITRAGAFRWTPLLSTQQMRIHGYAGELDLNYASVGTTFRCEFDNSTLCAFAIFRAPLFSASSHGTLDKISKPPPTISAYKRILND
jgi:hypothetical protein